VNRSTFRTALVATAACAVTTSLLAQVPTTMAPPQAMAPMAPPPKRTSLQITGAMTIPAFGYADYTSDIGWNATATLVLRRSAFNSIRIEGAYNSVSAEFSDGTFASYGGGIGGSRVVMRGSVQQEGYLILGAYNFDGQACTTVVNTTTCADYSEVQFGTKVGATMVLGRGKTHPVLDFHWFSTWSEPYVNLFSIGAGLRF
jgi:hypothetical protein